MEWKRESARKRGDAQIHKERSIQGKTVKKYIRNGKGNLYSVNEMTKYIRKEGEQGRRNEGYKTWERKYV